jgi:hypothetical protein
MRTLLVSTFTFPTVVFTVAVGLFVIYAMLKMLGFTLDAILDLFDGLFEFGDGADADGGHNFLDTIGVEGIPKSIVFGITSIFGWLASYLAVKYLDWPGWVVLIGALLVGFLCATIFLRPFKPYFAPPQATRRAELIGKTCVIRSSRVDANFGTAEVDDGGAGFIAEVRCPQENSLTVGKKAVVKDYDPQSGTYLVGDPSWT